MEEIKKSRFDILQKSVDKDSPSDFIKVQSKKSSSRFNVLKEEPSFSRFNVLKEKPKEEPSFSRFGVLSVSEDKKKPSSRNLGIFDKIKNVQTEKNDEKAEYYSHIKFRKEKSDSTYEVYKSNKYCAAIDISDQTQYDAFYPSTLGESTKPVIKSVWNIKKD